MKALYIFIAMLILYISIVICTLFYISDKKIYVHYKFENEEKVDTCYYNVRKHGIFLSENFMLPHTVLKNNNEVKVKVLSLVPEKELKTPLLILQITVILVILANTVLYAYTQK